jgi:hypothetical protein
VTDYAELADYEWLAGDEAAAILTDVSQRNDSLLAATSRLRKQLSAMRAHLLLELAELRTRATAKFAHADRMFFTGKLLEQATDGWIAGYKAGRFTGRGPIADLCCGIGGDLLALSKVGPTIGVDCDPIAICLAAANGRAVLPQEAAAKISLQSCHVEQIELSDYAAWHLDPDRRPNGSRTTSLEWSSPSLAAIEKLLVVAPTAAIKLAPAAEVPADWTDRCEQEWISRDRECRQLVAWHGGLAKSTGWRRATVLNREGTVLTTIVGLPNRVVPISTRIGQFIFDPDPALLAAHLTGELAAKHGLERISAGIAYLTGDAALIDPALACFEIDEVLPFERRRLASHLHERGIGTLEIKKRSIDVDPERLRRELKLRGDKSAMLILTPHNAKQIAILAHRVPAASPTSDLRPLASSYASRL